MPRALAVGDGVHYFAAAVGAVASGKVFRVRGLSGRAVDYDAPAIELYFLFLVSAGKIRVRRLSDREDDQIDM